MSEPIKKLFVVRKYVYAKDASEAISMEIDCAAHDVWIDDDWKKAHPEKYGDRPPEIGFTRNKPIYDERENEDPFSDELHF